MILAQIISERQMSDRLFTCDAIVVSLDVVTPAGNPVLATRRIFYLLFTPATISRSFSASPAADHKPRPC